jgi:hypothetical protein
LAGSIGRRTRWIVLAAAILVLSGVQAIVYGPFLRTWGRVLGVVMSLGYAAWRSLQGAPPDAALPDLLAALLAGAWFDTVLSLVVLFVLLRLWPRSDRSAAE